MQRYLAKMYLRFHLKEQQVTKLSFRSQTVIRGWTYLSVRRPSQRRRRTKLPSAEYHRKSAEAIFLQIQFKSNGRRLAAQQHSVIYEGPYIFTHVVEKGGSDFLIPMQIFDERNQPCTRSSLPLSQNGVQTHSICTKKANNLNEKMLTKSKNFTRFQR